MNELLRKIATLTYIVESYGDLGTERELECLRAELRQRLQCLQAKARPVQNRIRLVA